MPLRRTDKAHLVDTLVSELRGAAAAAVVSFRALPMSESSALRRTLRSQGGRLQVIPKRLFRRVLAKLEWPAALAGTADSVAVAWAADLLSPAKSLQGFARRAEGAVLLGGVLEGVVLDGSAVTRLAELPPPDILRRQFVGVLQGVLRGCVSVLGGVLRGLPAVLHAKAQQ